MKNINTIQISAILLLGFVTIGSLFVNYQYLRAENTYFQSKLSSFLVPAIIVDGEKHVVERGQVISGNEAASLLAGNKVLRVAWYSVANRLDPIFALEGTNPQQFKRSTELLAASLDDFAFLYNQDEKLIRESLHPLEFLRNLHKLEALRQLLIAAPNDVLVEEYHKELITTIELYNDDLDKLIEAWNELSTREDLQQQYDFLGGFSYIETYLSALYVLKVSSSYKKFLAEARWACYEGHLSDCSPLEVVLDKNRIFVDGAQGIIHKPVHSRNIKTNKDIILRYLLADINKHEFPQRRSLVALNQSICFPHVSPVYYLGWWTSLEENLRQFQISYINDLYFWELVGDFDEDWYQSYADNVRVHSRQFKTGGIDFQYQDAANLYMCPDMIQDISRVLKIYTIKELLRGDPLFINYVTPKTHSNTLDKYLSSLVKWEKEIITRDIINESIVAAYLHTLSSLLDERGEVYLAQLIGDEKVFFIEKILALYHQGSPQMNEIIASAAHYNYSLNELIARSGLTFGIDYLFAARSYPMTLFFGFNKSFTEDGISFLEYAHDEPEFKHLVSYNNFLKYKLSPEEIIEEMRIERELWEEK